MVYGLDPTGPAHAASSSDLGLPSMSGVGEAPGLATFTSAATSGARQREVRQNGLIDLAVPTGGLVVRDTFDHDRGLARILADQSGYYLVAYEPDAATFARIGGAAPFHDVEVKVCGATASACARARASTASPTRRSRSQHPRCDRYPRSRSNSARTVSIVSASPAGLSVR